MNEGQQRTEEALRRIAAGDAAGVDALYECLGAAMLAAATAVLHDRFAAEDAVQEAFLRVVRGIRGYRPGTNGRAWVLRIVRNAAVDRLPDKRVALTDDFSALAPAEDGEERAADRLLAESLLASLSHDGARHRGGGGQVEVVHTQGDRPRGRTDAEFFARARTNGRARQLLKREDEP